MKERDMNKETMIQDDFLNEKMKNNILLTIFLINGYKIEGKIKNFDKYILLIESENQEILIFKHAISTIISKR